jgi:hypothetical protein
MLRRPRAFLQEHAWRAQKRVVSRTDDRALVTGAAGLIGRHVLPLLSEEVDV